LVHFIDEYSRFTWIYPLKQKSEVFQSFDHFKNFVDNQFNKKIIAFQYDGGGESKALQKLIQEARIQLRESCPCTSAQNGRVERKHKHVVELGLTLLDKPKCLYWRDAFATAVFLINRLPSHILKSKYLYQLLFNKTPYCKAMKNFGCAC